MVGLAAARMAGVLLFPALFRAGICAPAFSVARQPHRRGDGMADKDQKTEQPTQRRMNKAREEGNFPTARVFVSALQFLAFVALLHSWGPAWIQSIRAQHGRAPAACARAPR